MVAAIDAVRASNQYCGAAVGVVNWNTQLESAVIPMIWRQITTGMYQIHIKEQMEAQYVSVCHKQVITICLQVKMLLLDNHRCRK